MNTKNKLFAPYAFKVYNMDWKVQIQQKENFYVCVNTLIMLMNAFSL